MRQNVARRRRASVLKPGTRPMQCCNGISAIANCLPTTRILKYGDAMTDLTEQRRSARQRVRPAKRAHLSQKARKEIFV